MNVREFGLALEGEDALRAFTIDEVAGMLERVEQDPSRLLGDEWELSDSDRAVMALPELAESIRESTVEMFRNGPDGWIDDSLCFTWPDWGFDLAEITIPVTVAWGAHDVLVPAAHGAWLAAHVPNAVPDMREDEGHMGDPSKIVERMRALVPSGAD